MREEQSILLIYWWEKLAPLRRKFVRETLLSGLDKEDLEQECFLQLHKAIERYMPEMGVPFESYYKIMLYGWRANQNRVKARMELAFGVDETFILSDERVNIEKDIETKILVQEVFGKLEALESVEREIIKAYYLQRKKLAQVATELGIPFKTVEFKKRKALGKLKALLGEV